MLLKKLTIMDREKLILQTANWLLQDKHEVNGLGVDIKSEVMRRGDVSLRQADKIISEAWERIKVAGMNEVKYHKGSRIMMLQQQIKDIKDSTELKELHKHTLVLEIQKEINKIIGVYAPTKVDATSDGKPINHQTNITIANNTSIVEKLSTDDLLKLIQQYGNTPTPSQRRDFEASPE